MEIEDPAPADGSSPLEVSIVRNFYDLQSINNGRIIYVQNLIVTHPGDKPGRIEGYMDDDFHGPFIRAFIEPLTDGFEFMGKLVGKNCQFREYVDAKVRIGEEVYSLDGRLIMMIEKNFCSQTHLWRFMEECKRGIARWQYKPDFSDIRVSGSDRPISNPLTYSEIRSVQR